MPKLTVERLPRNGLRVPLSLVGIMDFEELKMLHRVHWNGLTGRMFSCTHGQGMATSVPGTSAAVAGRCNPTVGRYPPAVLSDSQPPPALLPPPHPGA